MSDSYIEHAKKFPYNDRQPSEWSEAAAQAVLAELSDRSGIGNELDQCDLDLREEIVDSLAYLIKKVYENYSEI